MQRSSSFFHAVLIELRLALPFPGAFASSSGGAFMIARSRAPFAKAFKALQYGVSSAQGLANLCLMAALYLANSLMTIPANWRSVIDIC